MKKLNDLGLVPTLARLHGYEKLLWGQDYDPRQGGIFTLKSEDDGKDLRVIAASGDDWDHLSVSRADRAPSWAEMEQVKRVFFYRHEVAYQLHVAVRDHINCHPNCLHIWRPWKEKIPLPPTEFV